MVNLASFNCRKWTLFTLCLIGIIITIAITIVACNLIDQATIPANTSSQEWHNVKKTAKGIVIASGVITILIQMLGLFGSLKENYCMSLTYAILMTLATIGSLVVAIQSGSANWGSFVVNLIITVMAYLFARDLKELQRTQPGHVYTA